MHPRHILFTSLGAALLASSPVQAQQETDAHYRPDVSDPAHASESGPVVTIDAGHANLHTAQSRYAPFALLLRADGYRVRSLDAPFDAAGLGGTRVLVIANARGASSPGESAFTAEEIEALENWVRTGGSLLLVADHAPFGSAAAALARRFGVAMGNGYVSADSRRSERSRSWIDFYSGRGLGVHPITAGLDHLRSFTGQALFAGPGATPLLILPKGARETKGPPRKGGPARDVSGRAQAVALQHGAGRVVILGEAAMLTAQEVNGEKIGLTTAGTDHERFARNIIAWLSAPAEAP